MESRVHSLLHPNCHHQITYAKIYYPPPYEQEIWHYGKANVDHIRKAIIIAACMKKSIFNTTIKNILSNYIPQKTITCDV